MLSLRLSGACARTGATAKTSMAESSEVSLIGIVMSESPCAGILLKGALRDKRGRSGTNIKQRSGSMKHRRRSPIVHPLLPGEALQEWKQIPVERPMVIIFHSRRVARGANNDGNRVRSYRIRRCDERYARDHSISGVEIARGNSYVIQIAERRHRGGRKGALGNNSARILGIDIDICHHAHNRIRRLDCGAEIERDSDGKRLRFKIQSRHARVRDGYILACRGITVGSFIIDDGTNRAIRNRGTGNRCVVFECAI